MRVADPGHGVAMETLQPALMVPPHAHPHSSRNLPEVRFSTHSGRSEFQRLGELQSVIHLYAEVPHGALELRVAQKELASP